MNFTPPPVPNYGHKRAMTEADWSQVWSEVQQRWPRWSPTAIERQDWWAHLSYHESGRVRLAMRDVRGRYASDEPKLAWVLKSLQQLPRDERPRDDATEIVRVMAPPSRAEMVADLEGWDPDRVASRALGHWLQRAEVRQQDPRPGDDPREWSDLLLELTWASCRVARGMDVPSREVQRPRQDRHDGDASSLREFVAGHPGGDLERIVATPRVPVEG